MVLRRKFRGFSRKETQAGKAFKKESGGLTLIDMVKSRDLKGLKRQLGRSDTNLEETNGDGETALILAAMVGDLDALKLLIESGANIDAKSSLSMTALMAAAQNGDINALRYLLSKGADPNARKKDETTILMIAAMFGHAEIIEALLAAGVDVTLEDIYGYTALMVAGNDESAALLSAAEARAKKAPYADKTHGKKLKKALLHAGKKRRKSHAKHKTEKAHLRQARLHISRELDA